MAKTFDPNRVGGGTFSLVRDKDGNYSLKETGFDKIQPLPLPELGEYTASTPVKTKPADPTKPVIPPKTNTGGGGDGGGSAQADLLKQARDVSGGLEKSDSFADARRKMTQDNAYKPTSTFDAEQEDSLENRTSVSVKNPLDMAGARKAMTNLSDYNPGIQDLDKQTKVDSSVLETAGTLSSTGKKGLSARGTIDRTPQGTAFARPDRGTIDQIAADSLGTLGVKSTSQGTPQDIQKRQMGQLGFSAPASQDLEMDPGTQKRSDIKPTTTVDTIKSNVKNVLSNVKPVSLMVVDAISNAITSPEQQANNTANTTALRTNGYQTNFQGKVIGKDGKAVSAADSVFGGMNSRSAIGDISKGAASRISTRNSAKTQARISKLSPERQKAFNDKTKEFERELADHNNAKNSAKEKSKSQKSTNPNKRSGASDGGNGCFIKGTLITMLDGSKKPVEQVDLGDNVAIGGKVFAIGRFLNTELYDYKGIKVSGSHMVNEDGTWLRVRDTKHGKSLGDDLNIVYVFGSENRRILIDNILFTDYFEINEQDKLIEDSEDFFNNWKSYGNTINEHNVNTLNAN